MSDSPSATADELFSRGNEAADRHEWPEAAQLYERAMEIHPKHVMALNNLGYCQVRLGKPDLGALYLQRCLSLKPDLALALFNIIEALENCGRDFEMIPYLRKLVELRPEKGEHAFKLANILSGAGRTPEALFYYRQALNADPRLQAAISNYLLALNYADGLSVDYIAAEHFRLGTRWPAEPVRAPAAASLDDPQRPLRMGYLSGDFHTHPDGKTLAPIMAAHDRRRHIVFAYSDSRKDDQWTDKARASCDVFRSTAEMSDEALWQQIRDDQIDVLVEVRGHMGGHNRFHVLARRRPGSDRVPRLSEYHGRPRCRLSNYRRVLRPDRPHRAPSQREAGPPQARLSLFPALDRSAGRRCRPGRAERPLYLRQFQQSREGHSHHVADVGPHPPLSERKHTYTI